MLGNFISLARVKSQEKSKRASVLFARGALLLAVLIGLTGCPDNPNNAPPPLFAPNNLKGEAINNSAVLNWDAVPNATSYDIYRATADNPANRLSEGATTTYTDRDFNDIRGIEYTYTVRAVNANGASGPSDAVTLTPLPILAGVPTIFAAVGWNSEVALTWNEASNATEYSLVRSYNREERFGGSAFAVHERIPNVVGTTYLDTGLANGINYTYTLRGVSAAGVVSDDSIKANSTPDDGIPVAPTNFTVVSIEETTVTLAWDGHSSADEYRLHRNDELVVTDPAPLTATTYTDTDLEPGTTYSYTVRGVESENSRSSRPTDPLLVTTTAIAVPVAVTGLTTSAGDMRVALDWNRTANANTYNVYRDGDTTAIATGLTINSYIDSDVTNGTKYSYKVSATNSTGEGPQSTAATATPTSSDSEEGNLLITILSLEQLNNIRYNLAGTSYKTSATDAGVKCGASGTTDCRGYELGRSLDFQDPASYEDTYSHPRGVNPDWIPNARHDLATNAGWDPIGNHNEAFTAILNGNGHTISNLYSRALDTDDIQDTVGLFGRIASPAVIIDIGILNARLYGGNDGVRVSKDLFSAHGIINATGALVGSQEGGTIVASYAKGTIATGSSSHLNTNIIADAIGGLVGRQNYPGVIYASYVIGAELRGGSALVDSVGGLVGLQGHRVVASYAAGSLALNGGFSPQISTILNGSNSNNIGGLSGFVSGVAPIVASYTTYDTLFQLGVGGRRPVPLDSYAGLGNIRRLTAATVGSTWDSAADLTLGAWNFDGTIPALMYADYDGSGGNVFACSNDSNPPTNAIVINKCGDPLPGQE